MKILFDSKAEIQAIADIIKDKIHPNPIIIDVNDLMAARVRKKQNIVSCSTTLCLDRLK